VTKNVAMGIATLDREERDVIDYVAFQSCFKV
jgi:hypothetical protein